MVRRILILIAVLAVPLSLMAGPAVQAASAQGASTATVTPASGTAGSTVTGSGSNWTAGDHIQAYWSDDNSTLGGEVVVAPGGTFRDPGLKIPADATRGSHQILFSDIEGRYFVPATFDVTGTPPSPPPPPRTCPPNQTVTFSPSSGRLGTTFTITGSGWLRGGKVTSTLPYGSPGWFTGYQTPTVDANGGFSFKATVGTGPGGPTPPGTYTFTYVEKYGGCSLSFRQAFTVMKTILPANGRYLAVMYSRSLSDDFLGSSNDLGLAEGYAYNGCLRAANKDRAAYKNDCTRGWWVQNGYIAIAISGPFTNNHGLREAYAWGEGWASTLNRANSLALDYCGSVGGSSCYKWAAYSSVPGGYPPNPAHATAGGEFKT